MKAGQIAHADRDRSNNRKTNLVFLCLKHHNAYDSKSKQAKGFTIAELLAYREQLLRAIGEGSVGISAFIQADKPPQRRGSQSHHISLEIYDRRILVYRACRDYLNAVAREGDLPREEMYKFSAATEEAVFLFDQRIQDYIRELYVKGIELRRQKMIAERRSPDLDPDAVWAAFEEALEALLKEAAEVRAVFKPYFQL